LDERKILQSLGITSFSGFCINVKSAYFFIF